MERQGNYQEIPSIELSKLADEILKLHSHDIWGRELPKKSSNKCDDSYFQWQFEKRMQTGAFSRNSERGRK